MRMNILRARKIKKYHVCLSENEIRSICEALNEKAERLMLENSRDSDLKCRKTDMLIKKLVCFLVS